MDDKFTVKIIDILQPDPSARTFILEKPAAMTWKEGTNLHVALPGFDGGEVPDKSQVRHLSLMTLPEEGHVVFTTRIPGSGSPFKLALEKLKAGDELVLFKPSSRLPLRREGKPIVLLSMGVGIAAFRTLIRTYLGNREGIPSLTSINVDRARNFILREELDGLAGGGYGNYWEKDRDSFLRRLGERENKGESLYYVVGSDEFISGLCESLFRFGVPVENIVLDKKPEKTREILEDALSRASLLS